MSENNYAALMMKRAPTNSESWNNIKDPGIYPIAAGHPSAPDGAAGVLFVMPPKSGATQDFISTSKKRYTRTFNGSSWLVWSTGLYVGDFGLGGGSNHKADAYNNVGEIYRVNSTSANTPTTGVAGVISLPCDGGPSTAYVAASNGGSAWIGYSSIPANGVKWNRVYTTAYKPTADDVDAYSRLESDFRFILRTGDKIDYLDINKGLVVGLDTTVGRTLYVNGIDFIMKSGLQDPVNNERQTNGMRIRGGGDLFVDLYQRERVGQHHFFGIHVANGGADGWYEFRNDGSFNAGSTVGAGGAAGSKLYSDGNISGSMWGDYLSNWLNRQLNARDDNINTRATWDHVNQNFIQSVRYTAEIQHGATGIYTYHENTVLTGFNNWDGDYSAEQLFWSYIQIYKNGQWITIGR